MRGAAGLAAVAFFLVAGPAMAAAPISTEDREALTRVVFAEAANQGISGLTAVAQTILNRLASGAWGGDIQQVVNAPHQFEPVARAGGSWRGLPASTPAQRATIDTVLGLISDGRLPDFVGGALYFQNPRIVASRVEAGVAPASRLNFGGQSPSAVIGDHAFFAPQAASGAAKPAPVAEIFAGASPGADLPLRQDRASGAASSAGTPSPSDRTLFILPDGRFSD